MLIFILLYVELVEVWDIYGNGRFGLFYFYNIYWYLCCYLVKVEKCLYWYVLWIGYILFLLNIN